jgi:hypothetical protein
MLRFLTSPEMQILQLLRPSLLSPLSDIEVSFQVHGEHGLGKQYAVGLWLGRGICI